MPPLTVALLGNPNTGKSTLFSALSGVRQRTGNYPGVTVEKKIGRATLHGESFVFVDLPGTYSLAPRSPDEMVAVDVLLGRQPGETTPDAILCIVDASNLERNLYLVSQALEMGRPVVVALNMIDVAEKRGITIDREELGRRLGAPVVPIQANRGVGIDKLSEVLAGAAKLSPPKVENPFPPAFQEETQKLIEQSGGELPRFLAERLLLDTNGFLRETELPGVTAATWETSLPAARERLQAAGHAVPGVEPMSRYAWIAQLLSGVVRKPEVALPRSNDDKIDRWLTHWFVGLLAFAAIMLVMFQSIFIVALPFMKLIEDGIGALGDLAAASMRSSDSGELSDLGAFVKDGLIGGIGSVLVFLPQIFFLFFFIAVLEDCGYMARAAYLMDRVMSRVGLNGKAFIPLLASFACAIPGIMGTRVIEDRRVRLITILIAPLMSCSARFPVYVLLIGAFVPATVILWPFTLQGLMFFLMYLVGILVAIPVALLLRSTILPGKTPVFVLELPPYKFPSLRVVLYRMFERGWVFIRDAGTLIMAVAIVVWALSYYPNRVGEFKADRADEIAALEARLETVPEGEDHDEEREALQEERDAIDNEIAGAQQRQSYLGRAGQWIEPAVRPLGWDWRLGSAVIASFPAREVVVATLGVIYNVGEADEESIPLRERLQQATWDGTDRKVFNVPVALSVMVFFALCAQCGATLVVIKRETQSWFWPVFAFSYMTILAYIGAFITYQVGMMFVS